MLRKDGKIALLSAFRSFRIAARSSLQIANITDLVVFPRTRLIPKGRWDASSCDRRRGGGGQA